VVWSGTLGYQLAFHGVRWWVGAPPPRLHEIIMGLVALLAGIAGWAYYGVTAAPLTSIAHACAWALGALIGTLCGAASVRFPSALLAKVRSSPSQPKAYRRVTSHSMSPQSVGYGEGAASLGHTLLHSEADRGASAYDSS